jgi:ABC-type transporter Mla subunit MlaD
VLAACADREPDIFGNGDTLARLLDAIINQQQKLEQTSLELSELVFRDRPDAESKTIKSLWKRACAA